jgi:N-acetylmuramoyl-L-alanine amidase
VTGIRRWSTADYTRVAIDVEGDVRFSSQRIAHPSRIFFDLQDTKLASTLVGKTFEVDDGFLKKVRVAQFAPRRTRIVLEVDNLSAYDAFLLPNPNRLIIDLHSKNGRARLPKDKDKDNGEENKEADQDAVAKNVPDIGSDPNPSALQPAILAHAVLPAKAAPPSLRNADDTSASLGEHSPLAKPPQSTVVKKIVDADDGDGNHDVTSSPVDKLDSNVSGSRGNNIAEPGHKSTSRTVASRKADAFDLGTREARPTVGGDRSLIRALGLKIGKIVIDAGHGGHDTGTIGPNGLEEKDLVLEVARRLGKLLETRLGAEVVYTRKDDTFIPLETRTAIANQARADLFVSIHANSSHDPAARGVETYYLNFTSSPEALEVAARENAVSEKSIYELQDLVKKIALKEKIEESREFAWDVQQSLHKGLAVKAPAIRNRGVKKAPFIVLIGANMPSILAEISFVSNPIDEHRLSTSEYRQRIAESLYRGISKYVNGLSGVKVASKIDKTAGQ